MSDSRPTVVLFGAITVVVALFLPWYALDVTDAVRGQLAGQTGQLPGVVGEYARGMISLLPSHLVANGWEVFENADWVMVVCAVVGIAAAFGRSMGLAQLASGAAILTILGGMLVRRGLLADEVTLQWGAWLGLGGAVVMMVGSCMREPKAFERGADLAGWSSSAAYTPAPMARDTSQSVPPPG